MPRYNAITLPPLHTGQMPHTVVSKVDNTEMLPRNIYAVSYPQKKL